MKLSLILIALIALIASAALALPAAERRDIVRDIKRKYHRKNPLLIIQNKYN